MGHLIAGEVENIPASAYSLAFGMLLCEGKSFFGMFFDVRWRGAFRKAIASLNLGHSMAGEKSKHPSKRLIFSFWDATV